MSDKAALRSFCSLSCFMIRFPIRAAVIAPMSVERIDPRVEIRAALISGVIRLSAKALLNHSSLDA